MQYPWLTSIICIINSSRTKKKRYIRLRMYINAHNKKKLSCTQQNKMENMYPWKTIFKYTMTLKILTINININGNTVPCIVKASWETRLENECCQTTSQQFSIIPVQPGSCMVLTLKKPPGKTLFCRF